MAFTEDLTPFFNTDDFAVEATITPSQGEAFTVKGIFDNGYESRSRDVVDIASRDTMFTCPSSAAVDALVKGNSVAIGGANYKVLMVKPDGTGVTAITLEKAAA
tara:strand:+ start:591 stop:902 length:312 start_codon:yes stop_codon:yes gene_type:complete